MESPSVSNNSHDRVSPSNETRIGQRFEGFDFLRAIFAIAIIAYKTKIFYIPKILVPSVLTVALSDYILSGMFGALAVPAFLQISLFIFLLKSEGAGLRYFLKRRLPRLISLYLFWVISITLFDILFVDGWEAVSGAFTSPKNFLLFVVSGHNTPYFFFFSLIFVTIIAEMLVLLFDRLKKPATRFKISYTLLVATSILVFSFATIQPILDYAGVQSSGLKSLSNLTGWDYSPFNFLPYIFSAAITAQEYKMGKLAEMTSFLRRKLVYLALLTVSFFALEWVLTSHRLLIQVDQAPLDHYMRLSLVFGSWFLLYVALLIKQKPPIFIGFLAACSLGMYGFHVFFAFKRPLPLEQLPLIGSLFETFPTLEMLAFFVITVIGTILLTVLCKKVKVLKAFV